MIDGHLRLLPGAESSTSVEPGNMNLSRIFIERPVMTALVTFAILLFGIRGLPRAAGGGAAERRLSDDSGDRRPCRARVRRRWRPRWQRRSSASSPPSPASQSMSSTNAQGATAITVQFTLDRNIDAAAQDVQAAISRAGGRLPTSMPRPPSYQKANPAEQPVLYLSLDSTTLPLYTVNEYAETMLAQRISMVSGVSRVQVFGAQKYAVRVQVDPDQLAAHDIGIDEVQAGDRSKATRNLPTGRLDGDKQAFTIQSSGHLRTPRRTGR